MEDACKALKDALAGSDVDAVKQAHETLISVSPGVHAAALPERGGAADAAGATGGTDAGAAPIDDDVADAEIVDDEQSA